MNCRTCTITTFQILSIIVVQKSVILKAKDPANSWREWEERIRDTCRFTLIAFI